MWTVTEIIDGNEVSRTYQTVSELLNGEADRLQLVITKDGGSPVPYVELQKRALAGEIEHDA